MSDQMYPFDDSSAVKTYAILLDRQAGVLAAWKFLLDRGFAPEDIMHTLSLNPPREALEGLAR